MLVNVYLVYQHPPQGDVQYAVFCLYLAINTVVLLKKGNIDLDKIVSDIKEIVINKIDINIVKTHTEEQNISSIKKDIE